MKTAEDEAAAVQRIFRWHPGKVSPPEMRMPCAVKEGLQPAMSWQSQADSGLPEQNASAKAAWAQIQQRMKPPLCKGHSEPCVIRQVKKGGPNQGNPAALWAPPGTSCCCAPAILRGHSGPKAGGYDAARQCARYCQVHQYMHQEGGSVSGLSI